jgi:hypothetical protein
MKGDRIASFVVANQHGRYWGGMAGTAYGWGPRELAHSWAHYASAFLAARCIGPGAMVVEQLGAFGSWAEAAAANGARRIGDGSKRETGPSDLHLAVPAREACAACGAVACACWPVAGGAL